WDFILQVGRASGRDMTSFDNVLYHHININDDKAAALADSKRFLDLYYSADYGKERLEAWLTYGSPRDCIEHIRQFKASGCRRIAFRISTMGDAMVQLRRLAEEGLPYVDEAEEGGQTRRPERSPGQKRSAVCPSYRAGSYRRDGFDLQQEVRIGEPAQDAERAARRMAGKIFLQYAARLRHVVRIADVDRDLGDVGNLGAAGGERLGEVRHHHRGLGVEVVGRQHLAVDVGCDLAGAEHELLRALGCHHV